MTQCQIKISHQLSERTISIKKLIPLCLSVLLLVGLTACSGGSEENRATTATSGSESAAQESAGESNAAVIYFSATGNTEQVAQTLADKTGAALFEIEPEEPYTDADLDYNNDSCRANQEQNDPNARPAIAGETLDLSGTTRSISAIRSGGATRR